MIAVGKWSRALLSGAALLVSVDGFAAGVLIVKGPNSSPFREALDGFHQAYPDGAETDRRGLARKVHTDRPALIVAFGREAAETAHQQTPEVPLLFVLVADPAASGLTGNNVAGITFEIRGDVQLSRMKELLPDKKSVAVIHNPAVARRTVEEADKAAPGLGIHLEDVPVSSPQEISDRFNFVKPLVNAIWVIPDPDYGTFKPAWDFLKEQANRSGLPFILSNFEDAVAQGGALGALIPDYRSAGQQGAELARQITSGKLKIGEVGIRSTESARWAVNTKTARKLGLTIPRRILDGAKVYP